MILTSLHWVCCLLVLGGAHRSSATEAVLANVASIQTGGNPASLVAWGDAQPLVASPDGEVFAAAATLGEGRVVAMGHGGFVETDAADSEVFAANAIVWLAKREGVDQSPIRVAGVSSQVAAELTRRGIAFTSVKGGPKKIDFGALDVLVGSPQAFAKASREEELAAWIKGGGGMLLTETAWGVLQLNKDLTLDTLAANQLLEPWGLRFTGESHSGFGKDKDYPVDPLLLPLANADAALSLLAQSSASDASKGAQQGNVEYAAKVVGQAFSNVPQDSAIIRNARALADARRSELDEVYATLGAKRLTPKSHALARALIDLDSRLAMESPPAQTKAHASSAAFPGPVGTTREADAAVEIDPRLPGWHTTGLYAPPGEVVTITVPKELAGAQAFVQIGAWRDPHQHAYRVRLKNALRRFEIKDEVTLVASAIGGPIYIDLPEAFSNQVQLASAIAIRVQGAALAPHFKLGVTSVEEWRASIRNRETPWAEMETQHLVLTVPSAAIRDLDRPDLAMQHWDKVHHAMQSLEPRTANHWADRPYRYVADVSVSWGYMYCPSDGPIIIPASATADMFKAENFDADGENKLWGHYHEMGHAHQNPLWTDGSTGEVTVNIFTVFALHTVNGYPLDHEATRTTPKTAWETFEKHRAAGKKFEDAGGPFETLQFYALLWHEFGFEPFRETFERIRNLPEAYRPRGDDAERNQFVLTFSRAVGRNLVEYAVAWGIAVSLETRDALKELPTWMPEPPAASDAS
jgi:Peptidase M60, enhancin and enhancin-like/N-terminal domain of M60-like peptidases